MGETTTFALKVLIVVLAIPLTFFLVYWTGLLIAKMAAKYCPECQKRKKEEKIKKTSYTVNTV